MELTIVKEENQYIVKEKNRAIYTIVSDKKDKLLTIQLHNTYGDEVLGFYQIKKWYSTFRSDIANDFTMYRGEEKIGEIHKSNYGFDVIYHGVYYRVFGGTHAGKRVAICFDRETQVAQFTFDQNNTSTARFTNGIFADIFVLMMYAMKEVIKLEAFPEDAFIKHYAGRYGDIEFDYGTQ